MPNTGMVDLHSTEQPKFFTFEPGGAAGAAGATDVDCRWNGGVSALMHAAHNGELTIV
jgi:hypothetical protein